MVTEKEILKDGTLRPVYQHLMQIKRILDNADLQHLQKYKMILTIYQLKLNIFSEPLKIVNDYVTSSRDYNESEDPWDSCYGNHSLDDMYALDKKLVEVIDSIKDINNLD